MRLEFALNFDKVYPADTGRCGEPFAPRASCSRAYGFFSNSLVGTGIGGEYRYPYPWEDPQSLEGGARLEFRQDRLSYALTYFTGFDDFPYQEPIFIFERNVDPLKPAVPGVRARASAATCKGSSARPTTRAASGKFVIRAPPQRWDALRASTPLSGTRTAM